MAAAKTRTLYVREEDQPLWDEARSLIGDSLSSYVTNAMKTLVLEKRNMLKNNERIILAYKENGLPKKQAFYGKWVISPEEPYKIVNSLAEALGGIQVNYCAATTAKGNILFFTYSSSMEGEIFIFDSIESALESKSIPKNVISCVMEKMGVEVEELDI